MGGLRAKDDAMTSRSALTISLPPEVEQRLGALAAATHRTKATLAAEAVTAFVAHEAAIADGIHRGLADMKAGRLVPHAEAMNRLEAAINAAGRGGD